MPPKKKRSPFAQTGYRFPEELIARIDRHAQRMSAAVPGMDFSRADAVRSLLTAALDRIEAEERAATAKSSK